MLILHHNRSTIIRDSGRTIKGGLRHLICYFNHTLFKRFASADSVTEDKAFWDMVIYEYNYGEIMLNVNLAISQNTFGLG